MEDPIAYEQIRIQELLSNPVQMSALTQVCAETFATEPWYGVNGPEVWYGRLAPLRDAQDTIVLLAYESGQIVGFTWGYLERLDKLEKDRLAIANWDTSALDPVRKAGVNPVYYFAEIGVKPDCRGAHSTVNEGLMLRHLSECVARGYDSFLVRTTAIADVPLRWFRDAFKGKILYGPDDYQHKEHLVLLWVPNTHIALKGWKEVMARRICPAFLRLAGATIGAEGNVRYLATTNARYPIVDGIPVLLENPNGYLLRLRNFLEEQLKLLQPRVNDSGDRFWAEAQYARLQKRLQAVNHARLLSYGLQSEGESKNQSSIKGVQMDPKYDSELNTDIYTRIAWGYHSFTKGEPSRTYPDAGELYTTLAQRIGPILPRDGVFLEIGCGVGRTVFEAAQVATSGLAIGMDISFSKVARARRIVRGATPLIYPAREHHGLIEVQVEGQFVLNTLFAVGDGMDVQLPDGSVDCVVTSFLLGVVPDPERLLDEVFRILKPGGSLIIAEPFSAYYSYERPSEHRLTLESLSQLLERISPSARIGVAEPITYQEHWSHARTVTYEAQIVTARRID